MTKRWIASGTIVAAVAVAVVAWYALRGGEPAQAKTAKGAAPIPVRLGSVTRQSLPVTIQVIGKGEAKSSVTIRSRVDGQVAKIEFKEGEPVR